MADLPSAAALIRGLALLCPGFCTLAGSIQKQPISCPHSTPVSLEQRPSMGEPPGRIAGKLVPTRDAARHGLPPAPLGVRSWMAQRLKSKGGNLLLSASLCLTFLRLTHPCCPPPPPTSSLFSAATSTPMTWWSFPSLALPPYFLTRHSLSLSTLSPIMSKRSHRRC